MKNSKHRILNMIIVGLSIATAICVYTFFVSYSDLTMRYYDDEYSYLHYIGNQEYYRLPNLRYRLYEVDKSKKALNECVAVSDYYVNASLYKMFEEVEDVTRAEKHLEKMKENQKGMGDLAYTAQEIQDSLGITKKD